TNAAREVKGTVERRGLCGDVFLTSAPAGPRITDVKIDSSIRKGRITVSAAVENLTTNVKYRLAIEIPTNKGMTFDFGTTFSSSDVKDGRIAASASLKNLPDQ